MPRADELYDVAMQAFPYESNEEFGNDQMGGERLVVVVVGEPAVLERGVTSPAVDSAQPGGRQALSPNRDRHDTSLSQLHENSFSSSPASHSGVWRQ